MSALKLSMVSYINAKPFQLGLEQSGLINEIELLLEVPSESAYKLKRGEVDVALVPAASLREIPNAHIITNTCIAADGAVASVALFSQVPINQISRVILDSQSLTSVQLVQILMHEYWQQEVEFSPAYPGYENDIDGSTAAVIIGDRAIKKAKNYRYQYDLAEYWKKHTGLPFVFAVWVSTKSISPDTEAKLEEAFNLGIRQKQRVIEFYEKEYGAYINVAQYFEDNIRYQLDSDNLPALDLFLKKINQLEEKVTG